MSLVFAGRRKEPMRGGAGPDPVRGVTLRDSVIWLLYRRLARGDFHHDFGERTKTRDLITKEDENRFIEIAKNVSTKGLVALRAAFTNNLIGKTLYELLGDSFDRMVVPPTFSSPDTSFPDENALIEAITGRTWGVIKQMAETAEGGNPSIEVEVNAAGIARRYNVRSSSYRAGPRPAVKSGPEYELYKQNRNISTMFQEVTGKSKFALIVDATGGLALTDILNASLGPPPSSSCEFYIIQNIENASDSADKVQNIRAQGGASLPASLFYLRDVGDTVVYPLWGPALPDEIDQKSNIFASMQISLTRMKDSTVEADITTGPNTFHIGDVSNASNVKNATLAAAAIMVEKGIVPEVFVYTLIKRMGDWCQALSMLDLDRIYNTLNQAGGVVKSGTLRDMLVDTEIGVVTNDRILLAFCLLHGLNVFFTSAMDLARLIYFKNANDLPDGPGLTTRTLELYAEYTGAFEATKAATNELAASLNALVVAKVGEITTTATLPEYLAKVKAFTVIVSRLDSSAFTQFDEQQDIPDLVASKAIYDQTAIPRDKFAAVTKMIGILAKMKARVTTGQQAGARLLSGEYPGKSVIDVRVAALATKLGQGRAPNSVPIVEARDTLVRVREDVEMIMKNIPGLTLSLKQIFNPTLQLPEGRVADNHKEVLKGLDPTRIVLGLPSYGTPLAGGGRRGGGSNIPIAYAALRTRMIRVLPPGYPEQTSTTNTYVQGDDYVDDKLRAYTVVDEYIVTKEDATTFDVFFADDGSQPIDAAHVDYMCKRYMLLQFDMLRQKYEQFTDTFSRSETRVGEDDAGLVAVDIDEPATARAGTQYTDDLVTIGSTLQSIGAVLEAFTPENVNAYYNGRRVPSRLDDIPAAFVRCKRLLLAMFPLAVLTIPADNQQRVFPLSERYENIVLSTAAARLAGTRFALATIVSGAQVLTEQGVLLQTAIRDGVANYDEPVLIDLRPEVVNARVLTALTTWLTERGIEPRLIVYEIGQRLTTAQSGQGRKTHRRRLPKLI